MITNGESDYRRWRALHERADAAAMTMWCAVTMPDRIATIDLTTLRNLWLSVPPEARDRWKNVAMSIASIFERG